jgi:hypothetical protein
MKVECTIDAVGLCWKSKLLGSYAIVKRVGTFILYVTRRMGDTTTFHVLTMTKSKAMLG